MKFRVDIIFHTGSWLIIQSYSPGGTNSTRTGESRWALPRICSLCVCFGLAFCVRVCVSYSAKVFAFLHCSLLLCLIQFLQ